MLGVVSSLVWPVWNFALQSPTTRNTMQRGVQHVTSNNCWELLTNNVASVHWRIHDERGGDPPAPPLIFRPNWCPKGRKRFFFWDCPLPPHQSQGLDDRAPPLSWGLDPPLQFAWGLTSIVARREEQRRLYSQAVTSFALIKHSLSAARFLV